eukprot:777209-Amphidinium_carterae.1
MSTFVTKSVSRPVSMPFLRWAYMLQAIGTSAWMIAGPTSIATPLVTCRQTASTSPMACDH